MSGTEMLFLAVLALLVFGPRKLPEIGRQIGRVLGELKRASEDFKTQVRAEMEIESRSSKAGAAPVSGGAVSEVVPAELHPPACLSNVSVTEGGISNTAALEVSHG